LVKNNILIIGGSGFIGYHLAKRCLIKGWKVYSISSKPPSKKKYLRKVKYIIADISKIKILKKKIKRNFTYIVNLGGYVDHNNKIKTYQTHYIGLKNIINIFKKNMPVKFVQIGTSSEYGIKKSPHKENLNCSPKSVYGKSKLLSTKYLLKMCKQKNFPGVILRLYQAYGPNQDLNRFISIVINGCIKNQKFNCSEGKQFRDFIHVNDVVNSILKSLKQRKINGHIFNIGSGHPRRLKDIIYKIQKISKGGYPQFGKINLRKDESHKIYPNINKAKRLLGWEPKVDFEKGLKETIKFYKNEIK
jgi:nucleoside-diphosphate-sugar epimerase